MINAATSLILPNSARFTGLAEIHAIDCGENVTRISARGEMVIDHFNGGRPLVAIWDGDVLLAIAFSSVEGERLDGPQAEKVLAAVREGRVASTADVDAQVLAGQKAAMPTAEAMINAPLYKLSSHQGTGYMSQWHTRTGWVDCEHDELEILRQITGFDWRHQTLDLTKHAALAYDAVRRTLTEKRQKQLEINEQDAIVYDRNCSATHTVYVHRSGIAAIIDIRNDNDTLALAILVPGLEGPVTRTVCVRPTLTPRLRMRRAA